MTLQELSDTARKLANDLFNTVDTPAATCSQPELCLTKEEERPLTRAEKTQGWHRRPFSAYNPDNFCAGCRAYWFAEMAAQTLHEMRCWQRRSEAVAAHA